MAGRQADEKKGVQKHVRVLLRQKVAGYVCLIDVKAEIAVLPGFSLFGRGVEVLGLRGFGILKDADVVGILI